MLTQYRGSGQSCSKEKKHGGPGNVGKTVWQKNSVSPSGSSGVQLFSSVRGNPVLQPRDDLLRILKEEYTISILHSQAGWKQHGVLHVVGTQHPFGLHESLTVLLYLCVEVGEDCHFNISNGDVSLFPCHPQGSIPIFIFYKFCDKGTGGSSLRWGGPCRHAVCPLDCKHGGEGIPTVSILFISSCSRNVVESLPSTPSGRPRRMLHLLSQFSMSSCLARSWLICLCAWSDLAFLEVLSY